MSYGPCYCEIDKDGLEVLGTSLNDKTKKRTLFYWFDGENVYYVISCCQNDIFILKM